MANNTASKPTTGPTAEPTEEPTVGAEREQGDKFEKTSIWLQKSAWLTVVVLLALYVIVTAFHEPFGLSKFDLHDNHGDINKKWTSTTTTATSTKNGTQTGTMHTPTVEMETTAFATLCNQTNHVVQQVYNRAMSDSKEAKLWKPFLFLSCNQLVRALPTIQSKSNQELQLDDHYLSLHRLADKLQKLEHPGEEAVQPLKIVVIGGSMTAGAELLPPKPSAWPRKLEQFLQYEFGSDSVEVINLAMGGASEGSWLNGIDVIMQYAPFDVILVELAVNDQTDFSKQEEHQAWCNETSHLLLNILTYFPSQPAVISVELFRIAFHNRGGAQRHCRNHIESVIDQSVNDQPCLYCPQWWFPQDWRKAAREFNSVSYVSYRDAVWPELEHPPEKLCQYWRGLSHPDSGGHAMVASTILFQFLSVFHSRNTDLESFKRGTVPKVPLLHVPNNVCLTPTSSFHAQQGDPHDDMNTAASMPDSCWKFRTDVQDKYGWICEESRNIRYAADDDYFRLHQEIRIGKQRSVILSRLVSYDERMAMAQVWFTDSSRNIFVGDPVWNISSSHKERTSIPQPFSIALDGLKFKDSKLNDDPTVDVACTFNLRLVVGSSAASQKDEMKGVDKFKLLQLETC